MVRARVVRAIPERGRSQNETYLDLKIPRWFGAGCYLVTTLLLNKVKDLKRGETHTAGPWTVQYLDEELFRVSTTGRRDVYEIERSAVIKLP